MFQTLYWGQLQNWTHLKHLSWNLKKQSRFHCSDFEKARSWRFGSFRFYGSSCPWNTHESFGAIELFRRSWWWRQFDWRRIENGWIPTWSSAFQGHAGLSKVRLHQWNSHHYSMPKFPQHVFASQVKNDGGQRCTRKVHQLRRRPPYNDERLLRIQETKHGCWLVFQELFEPQALKIGRRCERST